MTSGKSPNSWEWISLCVRADPVRVAGGRALGARPQFALWMCTVGRGSMRLMDQDISVVPGTVVLIPPGVAVVLRRADRTPQIVEVLFDVRLRGRLIQDARPHVDAEHMELRVPGMPELSLVTQARLGSIGDRLLQAAHFYADPDLRQMETISQLMRALIMLRAAHVEGPGQFGVTLNKAHRAARYLYRNVGNPETSLASLAAHAGLSQTHLVRLFRREYQTSPMRFLLEQRMSKARRLLEHADFKIAEIAELVGFSSPEFFSRTFRAEHGMSPREYRKSMPQSPYHHMP